LHTCILVIEFEEITLLVEFVGVAVKKRKDRLKLGDRVLGNIHDGWLMTQDH
jgi:hypothetical protein